MPARRSCTARQANLGTTLVSGRFTGRFVYSANLAVGLPDERVREHAILYTDPHQFCRIAFDRREVDAMLPYPWLKLDMGCDPRLMPFFDQSFTKCNVRLDIAARADSEASYPKRGVRLEPNN